MKQTKNTQSNLKVVVIGLSATGNAVVEHLSHTDLADKVRLAVIDIEFTIPESIKNNDEVKNLMLFKNKE